MCVSTQMPSRIPLCSGHGQLGAHSKGNCSLNSGAELHHRNGLEYVSGRKNYYCVVAAFGREGRHGQRASRPQAG